MPKSTLQTTPAQRSALKQMQLMDREAASAAWLQLMFQHKLAQMRRSLQ